METFTKEDKLIFFGVTFASLSAFIFIISYINPFSGISLAYVFFASLTISCIISVAKFGYKKGLEKYKNMDTYFIAGIIWSILAIMKWIKYFNKNNFNWLIASLFTFVAIVNWVSYFKRNNKIRE